MGSFTVSCVDQENFYVYNWARIINVFVCVRLYLWIGIECDCQVQVESQTLGRNVELISNRNRSRGFSGGARNDLLGTTLWALLVLNNRILVPPAALDGQDNSAMWNGRLLDSPEPGLVLRGLPVITAPIVERRIIHESCSYCNLTFGLRKKEAMMYCKEGMAKTRAWVWFTTIDYYVVIILSGELKGYVA